MSAVQVTMTAEYGSAFVPLLSASYRQWEALGDLYAVVVDGGACLSNGSRAASGYITAGGWNLIAPLSTFPRLLGAASRIVQG